MKIINFIKDIKSNKAKRIRIIVFDSIITFYIFAFISLLAPILILVMTTLMDGTVSVDPQTGVETIVKGMTMFSKYWVQYLAHQLKARA